MPSVPSVFSAPSISSRLRRPPVGSSRWAPFAPAVQGALLVAGLVWALWVLTSLGVLGTRPIDAPREWGTGGIGPKADSEVERTRGRVKSRVRSSLPGRSPPRGRLAAERREVILAAAGAREARSVAGEEIAWVEEVALVEDGALG